MACFLIAGWAIAHPRVDNRNFAIDTYYPSPNEVRLAETRARDYWDRNASRVSPEPPYLAVTAGTIFPSEITQNLWAKLISAETTASVLAHGGEDLAYHDFTLHGVMIFDTRTGHLTGTRGYVVADTPRHGGIARFGDHVARFIGAGN
ncbi:MAG: hypothetical protein JO069_06105 [Verrucomicrobia bacterium]|nr:hypothetical protein [Verrucomicrobiota bacterium]